MLSLSVAVFLLCRAGGAFAEMASIASEDVGMRSGPGTQHEVLWKLGSGFPVEVIKNNGEWLQIKDFEGTTGWIKKNVTQKTPYMIVKANKDSKKQVEVHGEPNEKGKVVATASYGVVFKTLEKKGSWVKVEHGQGVTGWLESNLLWGF